MADSHPLLSPPPFPGTGSYPVILLQISTVESEHGKISTSEHALLIRASVYGHLACVYAGFCEDDSCGQFSVDSSRPSSDWKQCSLIVTEPLMADTKRPPSQRLREWTPKACAGPHVCIQAFKMPEKVPWGTEKKQKDGPCFRIHSVNLCLFIVEKIVFSDFVEYVFCAFELVFFSFFYPNYSKKISTMGDMATINALYGYTPDTNELIKEMEHCP
ncbi:hypothetical protein STEG23_011598 [Scotinomys teguina]